jgi:hypothetical protein
MEKDAGAVDAKISVLGLGLGYLNLQILPEVRKPAVIVTFRRRPSLQRASCVIILPPAHWVAFVVFVAV